MQLSHTASPNIELWLAWHCLRLSARSRQRSCATFHLTSGGGRALPLP
jgi:hypothetical protein